MVGVEEKLNASLYYECNHAECSSQGFCEAGKNVPSGVHIVRTHGMFASFLDLSPVFQKDIINRLDPMSTFG